jgi:choline dehydrogenase-like flavoprotein
LFTDARSFPRDTVIDSDICVVGAGAAGITLALDFAAAGLRVCLLESGGFAPNWENQRLAEGESIGSLYSPLDSSQLRLFGGNTNAWGGWFRGFDKIDFRHRAWVDGSGWPFDMEALAPYAGRAHEICEVPCVDYAVQSLSTVADPRARLIPFDPARVESVVYRFSPPTRFGRVYRRAVERADAINCLINAHALKVETTWDGRHVTAIDVGCLAGGRFKVTGRAFVLAAGAIENARLLLLSNDILSAGLGNTNDVVGRYFMDHPHILRPLLAGRRDFPFGLYGLTFRDRGFTVGLSIPATLQRNEKILNYKASIHPIFSGHDSSAWHAFRDLVLRFSRKWGLDPYDRLRMPFKRKTLSPRQVADVLCRLDKVALGAFSQAVRPQRLVSRLVLESKPEQAPNWASRVMLGERRDAFGSPQARVDWRLSAIDRHTVARSEEIIGAELRRIGIAELPSTADRGTVEFVGGWHQIGTTRMHSDPRHGVVDANCRVHGMQNLFIAGASVFPTGGSVSPMPTLLALALRLADHVKQLLQSPSAVHSPSAEVGAIGVAGAGGDPASR